MSVDAATVRRIAHLARIAVSDDEVAPLGGEITQIDAYRCGIAPCVDCRWCWTHAECALHDGMARVFAEMDAADNLVIASPVYFSELTGPLRVTARTRYHQAEQQATVYPAENGFRLEFDQPQRAPTPGQAAVLYQGDVVLGGGTITRVEK